MRICANEKQFERSRRRVYALRDRMAPIIFLTFPHRIMPTLTDRQTADTDEGAWHRHSVQLRRNC